MLTAVKPNKHCPIDVGILLSEYFKSTFLMLSFLCVFIGMRPLEIALTISPSSTVCRESER